MAGIGFFSNYRLQQYFKAVRADGGTVDEKNARAAWESMPALAKQKGKLFFLPGCSKTGTLYFMTGTGGIVSVPFTRANTTGTFINSLGKYENATTNVPRFEYDPNTLEYIGSLMEYQRANICLQSNGFSTTWANVGSMSLTSGQTNDLTTAGNDMWLFARTSTGSATSLTQSITLAATTYSFSIHVKAGTTGGKFGMKVRGGSTRQADMVINLSTGAVDFSAVAGTFSALQTDVRNMGNGIWRMTMMFTTGTAEAVTFRIGPTNLATNAWEGTNTVNSDAYVFGAQCETFECSSYIPTTTVAVTRSQDSAVLTGINSAPHSTNWFTSTTEGTVLCKTGLYSVIGSGCNSPWEYRVSTGSTNRIYTDYQNSALLRHAIVSGGSTVNVSYTTSLPAIREMYRMAFGFKVNDYGFSLNGRTIVTNTSAAMPVGTIDRLGFGSAQGATGIAGGYINYWVHIPSKLASADIVTLST